MMLIVKTDSRSTGKVTLLITLLTTLFLLGCAHTDTLVGRWRSDPPANVTIEFSRDGAFRMNVTGRMLGNDISIPTTGTYQIVDTNHVTMTLDQASAATAPARPFTALYAVSGDELVLQNFMSAEWGGNKYRRVSVR